MAWETNRELGATSSYWGVLQWISSALRQEQSWWTSPVRCVLKRTGGELSTIKESLHGRHCFSIQRTHPQTPHFDWRKMTGPINQTKPRWRLWKTNLAWSQRIQVGDLFLLFFLSSLCLPIELMFGPSHENTCMNHTAYTEKWKDAMPGHVEYLQVSRWSKSKVL